MKDKKHSSTEKDKFIKQTSVEDKPYVEKKEEPNNIKPLDHKEYFKKEEKNPIVPGLRVGEKGSLPEEFLKEILLEKIIEDDKTLDQEFLDDVSNENRKARTKKRLSMHQREKKTKEKFSLTNLQKFRLLRIYLYKAGIDKNPGGIIKKILISSLILSMIGSVLFMISYIVYGAKIYVSILLGLLLFVVFFFVALVGIFLVTMIVLDYLSFRRRLILELILPEYLRLVAANHRAGMPLDRSLWQANRPRFGILAKEIELLAKTTYVKGDLTKALLVLGKKYDSRVLERAMANIGEALMLGGNVSELLEDIATNITRFRNMKKDMAATIKNYVIFIVISSILIAPFMFGVSFQMNATISKIKADLDTGAGGGLLSGIQPGGGISIDDFQVFILLMMATNSIISALVISMIKYGNLGQGLKQIPVFFITSVIIFLSSKSILSGLFA